MATTRTAGTGRRPRVEALFSASANPRKYHLSPDCSALDRLRELGYDPADKLEVTRFGTLAKLAADPDGRLCRVCALERTLVSVLRRRGDEPMTFITASAQKSAGEAFDRFGRTRTGYRFDTCTESAATRLQRIGARTGLPVVHTSVGPVIYGFVPTRAVGVLTRNLRTIVRPEVTAVPTPDVISVVWGLFAADPPELRAALTARGRDVPAVVDPWLVADLIFAA